MLGLKEFKSLSEEYKDNLVKEFNKDNKEICGKCGTQRCDGTFDWIQGCPYFIEFIKKKLNIKTEDVQLDNKLSNVVKSINYSQTDIIKDIINLYIPSGEIDVDVTYSKGNFYKEIKKPKYCYDLEPQVDDVIKADYRDLPLKDNSVKSLMFDPPFLATTGQSLKKEEGNIINKRFSVYNSEKELFQMYYDALNEFHRVLDEDGILIVKCQDKISSSKQYMSHTYIQNMAEEIGFYVEDLFILCTKTRLVADWQARNQKHSRKFHSYFYVLRKTKKQVMSYEKVRQMIDR